MTTTRKKPQSVPSPKRAELVQLEDLLLLLGKYRVRKFQNEQIALELSLPAMRTSTTAFQQPPDVFEIQDDNIKQAFPDEDPDLFRSSGKE